jgi:hypothetical protein
MMIERNELGEMYDQIAPLHPQTAAHWLAYSAKERGVYNYIELIYELLERVYMLRQKK